jgi:putative hydrolase of the HAD superfamily
MIDAIIFDFGNVFINLDATALLEALKKLGITDWNEELDRLNQDYETGKMEELAFIQGIQKQIPHADLIQIREAWNAILLDFPLERLEFLQMLTSKYKLYLLSNTDATHIEKFEHKVGQSFAREFYSCFEKVYFSFEFGFRKPEAKAFQFVLNNHNLTPKKTLFVDDKLENIKAAEELGIQTWHLQVGQEDVVDLFQKNIL